MAPQKIDVKFFDRGVYNIIDIILTVRYNASTCIVPKNTAYNISCTTKKIKQTARL